MLRNMQIDAQRYAYQNGVDKPELDQWKWPDPNKSKRT
jgi:xylulose-5-phosphate/fructose-6-phosphate phosphoketolase